MQKGSIILLFLLFTELANAQKDTLKLHGIFNLQGRHQSGNLNQLGGIVLTKVSVVNSNWYGGVSASYAYAKIEEFNAVNDFWSNGIVKQGHLKRVYPMAMLYSGFAKSFRIDEAYVGGVGGGVNIIQKSPGQYLNVNIIGGYATFSYAKVSDLSGLATNMYLSSNTNLFKGMAEVNWEFHAFYLPQTELGVTGIQNNVRLSMPIAKAIQFTLTHQYLYNSYVDVHIAKENSMLLFGVMIKR